MKLTLKKDAKDVFDMFGLSEENTKTILKKLKKIMHDANEDDNLLIAALESTNDSIEQIIFAIILTEIKSR